MDITGSASERRFFHTFRIATEAGVALHVGNVSSFWANLAPRVAFHDDAVKHALVALGATYHFFKTTREGSRSAVVPRYTSTGHDNIQELEIFIIQQYNLAIENLRTGILSGDPKSIITALSCSLVFICLENLRFNHRGAITHLMNGIQIIKNSVDLEALFRSSESSTSSKASSISPFISDCEIRGVIKYFRHLEICERLFSYDVPLYLASHLSQPRRFNNGNTLPEAFSSLPEAYEIRLELTNDVMGRDWETREHRGDTQFWSRLDVTRQHECLWRRARLIWYKYKAFMAGPLAPLPGTREYASACLDMVQIKSMHGILDMMPLVDSDHHKYFDISMEDHSEDLIHYAEELHETLKVIRRTAHTPLDFITETGLVAPMYFLCVYSRTSEHRARALKILSETYVREGPWDGQSLVELIQVSINNGAVNKSGGAAKPLRRWGGAVDCYGLFSALSINSW